MEIKIDSKRNNPLLNRTEVHFRIRHEGEKTPDKEIIRGELAGKINAKKENIIINDIRSSSGILECIGYAKIYPSIKKAEGIERKYILKRNKIAVKEKKKVEEKKTEKKPEETVEVTQKEEQKKSEEPQKAEKIADSEKKIEKPPEEKKE